MATDGRPQGKDVHRLLGRLRALFLAIALAVGFGWQARPGQALEDPLVCAQAVIAVDASGSTASSAFDRQRIALLEAFRHPQLAAAVQDCLPGSFGVLVMTWAGLGDQHVCVP